MLLESLRRILEKDPLRTTVVDMTPLGLVEVTRKKGEKSLWEQLHAQYTNRRTYMKFIKLEKVKDGKYLKNYEITYLNKAGKRKNI